MFLSFAVNSKADSPVINGSIQMSTGGSQTFTASGGTGPYTWSKVAGGGDINSSTGGYTAPTSNENCLYNPVICVEDSAGQRECTRIAVNNQSGNDIVMVNWSMDDDTCAQFPSMELIGGGCCAPKNRPSYWPPQTSNLINVYWNGPGYYCDGTSAGLQADGRQCSWSNMPSSPFSCDEAKEVLRSLYPGGPTAWGTFWHNHPAFPGDGWIDYRTDAQKTAGCCPYQALGDTEPNSKGDTGDSDDPCKKKNPTSPNVPNESAANLKSGNLYHDQKVGTLILSYNSIDTYDGPLGSKWTHNYDLKLTALSNNATLKLKTEDGNVIYFHLSGSVYYPEAISGDTSQIVRNSDNTYTRTMKNGTIQQYSTAGLLTSITDRNSNTITLTYSGGNLDSITDQNNRTTTITTTSGKITAITDALGRTHSLTYSGGLLTAITDPLGNAWHYTYDTAGRMLTKVDPLSNTITYAYNASGRLLTSTDPESKTRTMNYTASGTTTFTEKDGGIWTYTYDPAFTVKTSQTDPLGNTTYYTYDLKRNLTSVIHPDNTATIYTYDANGNMTSETDQLNNTTTYTYNSLNLVTSRTDPRGNTTNYTYSTTGNLLTITDPAGGVTSYQYNTKGKPTSITDARGKTTTLAYDTQNNLTSITNPLGQVTSFTYDAVGNVLSITDPLNHTTAYAYNSLNQMTQMTDPRGATSLSTRTTTKAALPG